jgi:HSP20 family protein
MNLITLQRSPLNPWYGLRRLSNFHDDLERLFTSGTPEANPGWVPALDFYEEKDNYVVNVELPGVSKEDVKLSLEDNTLSISGERKGEAKCAGECEAKGETTGVQYSERVYGKFSRTVELPASVVADKVTAQYKDGILRVTLPKSEESKPRQITIGLN